ncbi:DUF6232 family protein [Methylophilus flavus]|uniref:DUF6232 family protein n=1 Tax=Methylophilus flavus TaxID=640084 RepID=A0ABW3P9V8_9PROT
MDENILFSHADVKVSREHLDVHGKIYPVSDIHLVESRLVEPKRITALILLFSGMTLLLDEGSLFAVGGFLVLLGIVFWVSGGSKYSVVIHTAGGEHRVITSNDRLFTEKVITALDTAMLNNGSPIVTSLQSAAETSFRDNNKDIRFGAS